jgi:isoleucyl-tRNA synthetase
MGPAPADHRRRIIPDGDGVPKRAFALEQARAAKAIGGGLEAKVLLHVDPHGSPLQKLLEEQHAILPALFIVSQVEVTPSAIPASIQAESLPELSIKIVRAAGAKCERCWNYSTHVGQNSRYPTICERCSEAISEIEGDASPTLVPA